MMPPHYDEEAVVVIKMTWKNGYVEENDILCMFHSFYHQYRCKASNKALAIIHQPSPKLSEISSPTKKWEIVD